MRSNWASASARRGASHGLRADGLRVAVVLFLDATIVRLGGAPSVISLLGDRCWYLPFWLGWLPRVEVSRHPQAQAALSPKPASSAQELTTSTGRAVVERADPQLAGVLSPQHLTAPRLRAGRNCAKRRRWTSSAPVIALTATGLELFVVEPLPSLPFVLSPHIDNAG